MRRAVVAAVLLLALAFPVGLAAAAPPSWNLMGGYTVNFTCTSSGCGDTYVHTMTITNSDNTTGAVAGTGSVVNYPDSDYAVTGTISGSDVTLDIEFSATALQIYNPLLLTGAIDSSGHMSGTAADKAGRTFDWVTTDGAATPVATTGTLRFIKVIDNWVDGQGTPPLGEFTLTYAGGQEPDAVSGTAHDGDTLTLPLGDYVVGEEVSSLPSDYAVPSDSVRCVNNLTDTNTGDDTVAYLTAAAPDWTCTVHNLYSVPIFQKVIVGGSASLSDFTFTIAQGDVVTTIPGSELEPSADGMTGTYYGGALVGSYTITETIAPPRYRATYDMNGLVKSTNCSWVADSMAYEAPPTCVITNTYAYAPPPPAPVAPQIALAVSASPTSLVGSGSVTYTYSVTNPGSVALSAVSVADTTCIPAYVSGDANSDGLLQPGETWIYTCTATLSVNTTDAAKATGTGNAMSASASAATTVTVTAAPVLTPVILSDGIAAGVNRGTSGFGARSVVVPPNLYVTVLGRTSPTLAGSLVEIWVQSKTSGWHSLTLRRVAADGTVHYFARVNGWTAYWVKFPGDATHSPAGSHGRVATNPR